MKLYNSNIFLYLVLKGFLLLKATSTLSFSLKGRNLFLLLLEIIITLKSLSRQAKSSLNQDLEIFSEGLAVIPTEWKTEILCYEFKGRIDDTDFLVYINAETGREENILVIVDTPNGTLTV